jgi:lysophospholipase L1-like esterase
MTELSKWMAALVALLGPASSDSPQELLLKPGDQIVAIGDSITQDGGYLRNIDAVLAAQYPDLKLPKIINVGISGQKAEDLIQRFQRDVVDKKPQWLTLSIGINDVWHRVNDPHKDEVLKNYTDNVAKMVDAAQAAGIKVILLSPTVITEDPSAEGNKRLKSYVEAEQKIAAEKKCRFANLYATFLTALEKKPADTQGNYLTSDGVHMNGRGGALMALCALRQFGVPDAKIVAADSK